MKSAEDRAREIDKRHYINGCTCSCGCIVQVFTEGIAICPKVIADFTQAIKDAVRDEKEANAVVADECGCSGHGSSCPGPCCFAIASAIRKRGLTLK